MANALLTPEHGAKQLITNFHLALELSSLFKKHLSLNIVVTSVKSYLKALRKKSSNYYNVNSIKISKNDDLIS